MTDSRNGAWKMWVIGVLTAIIMGITGIAVGQHLESNTRVELESKDVANRVTRLEAQYGEIQNSLKEIKEAVRK